MRLILLFGLISLCFLAFIFCYHSVIFTDKNLHVIFCNVGQGDGIFVRTPKGIDVIIDGGPEGSKMLACLSRHMPFFDRTIDAVYLTHPDADHVTGLIDVVASYNVKYFGTPRVPKETAAYQELSKILAAKKIPVDWVEKGDRMMTNDGLALIAYWPTSDFLRQKSEETNDYSLTQKLTFGKFHALLTGDVASVYLNSIMPTLDYIDVFQSPHHGSKTGVDQFTFQHLVPKLAVLSYGKNNRYHHPSPLVIEELTKHNIPNLDTSTRDIEIITDGTKWWIK